MPLHLLQIAKKLAHDAGQMAMKFQKKGFKVKSKDGHANIVTEADLACEKLIIDTIKRNFPDHSILSEEAGLIEGTGDYKWIIDPIDGTSNFAAGMPFFAVSIAVIRKGKPIIGVIDIPGTKEQFWAQEGQGAHLGTKPIHVSSTADFKNALLSSGFPYQREGARREKTVELYGNFQKISRGIRRTGSACLDLAYVAAGRFESYWEYNLEPWDIAAGKIIVEEAGGMVTNMDGSKLNPKLGNLLASNSILHGPMMEMLKKYGAHQV